MSGEDRRRARSVGPGTLPRSRYAATGSFFPFSSSAPSGSTRAAPSISLNVSRHGTSPASAHSSHTRRTFTLTAANAWPPVHFRPPTWPFATPMRAARPAELVLSLFNHLEFFPSIPRPPHRPRRIVFVCSRNAKHGHHGIADELLTVPSWRSSASLMPSKYCDLTFCTVSGSSASPSEVESTMSAKRTVTVFGVVLGSSADKAAPQARQNRATSGFASPHALHSGTRQAYDRRGEVSRARHPVEVRSSPSIAARGLS